ncbi:hypothetical protein BDN71DRAFT_1487827 [Pleurotus eryngii]|uniref:Uncharacterized protein n=1 Tax=Pleurotus eryngii TaxID=5323 RepID=A0A9P6A2S7_PLEER|nr:hypothetical protein BDN71DRAFT_1487827 [Pleurotus eryngii]
MARATRSTTQNQEKESSSTTTITPATNTSPPRPKTGSKKRKRPNQPDSDEPVSKQHKTDSAAIKEENDNTEHPDEEHPEARPQSSQRPVLPLAGDAPITPEDAQRIADILETIDTQGLLDRVFPSPSEDGSSPSQYRSLRWLLKEDSPRPKLSTLRSAIQHLVPISSQSRSKPSKPAIQQRRFCDVALSLFEEASFHNVTIPSDLVSLLPETQSDEEDISSSPPRQQKRYALKQRLPTGEWWTSLANNSSDPQSLKALSTGLSELVVSLPTPSAPTAISVAPSSASSSKPSTSSTTSVVPSLGSYTYLKAPPLKAKPWPIRRVKTTGSFLDYGPSASFAPTFSQDGAEVGRQQLGEFLWRKEQRRKERQANILEDVESRATAIEVDDNDNIDPELRKAGQPKVSELEEALTELLPPEEVYVIKSALDSLELEAAVQELLDRNARALLRLQKLQRKRLLKREYVVAEGSEELDTAKAIMDSLELLASLRPRSSKSESAPLIPPPALLRVLYKTIPISASPGWYGTLPAQKAMALHDNTTVKVKVGTGTTNATTVNSTIATPAAPSTPTPAYYQYGAYGAAAQQYRPPQAATSYTFKPHASSAAYYPSAYANQQQSGTQQPQAYAPQNYPYAATGQMSYGSWYSYAPQYTTGVAGGSNSGRATPTQTPQIPTANSYGSFFASTSAAPVQPVRTPAVANTVTNKGYQTQQLGGQPLWPSTPNGFSAQKPPVAGQTVVQPTLPAHLRSSAAQGIQPSSTPGTPAPGTPTPGTPAPLLPGAYQQQTPYYNVYQQPAETPAQR